MLAFKAFKKDLTGRGFQFEPGKTYIEETCKCASNGFHCAENPLCCLTYYSEANARYFIVKAEGEVNQDGHGTRISCTELTLVKEISLIQMGVYACQYIQKYPDRELESNYAVLDNGICNKDFLIVVGEKPTASGKNGSVIFFLEKKNGQIINIYPIKIGEDGYEENKNYYLKGGKIYEKKSNK